MNTYQLEKFESGMHYFMLDTDTTSKFLKNGNKRLKCNIDNLEFHCAIMPKKEGGHFINIGAAICKKLNLSVGRTFHASFRADETEYQFDMPDEFKAVLETDPNAEQIFRALTEGNQRGLIYLVSQVKSTGKRIERALKIAERMKDGIVSPRLVLK